MMCNVRDTFRFKRLEEQTYTPNGDPQNVIFVTVSISYDHCCEFGNKNGTILQHYLRNKFAMSSEPFTVILKTSTTKTKNLCVK